MAVKSKPLPDLSYLHECFTIDPEVGVLVWRIRPRNHFSSDKQQERWNRRYSLTPAGAPDGQGYVLVGISSKLYKAHRIALALYDGGIPEDKYPDHINGDKADNRRCNLRLCDWTGNVRNARLRRDSTCGLKGVHLKKSSGRWGAGIAVGGRRKHLGYFATKEEAYEVYCQAAKDLHGQYARTS